MGENQIDDCRVTNIADRTTYIEAKYSKQLGGSFFFWMIFS